MSVLLGVIDEPIGLHPTSIFTNKVGGEPDADNNQEIAKINKCSICGQPLSHITQIYCPLADSPYHRTLNIFACVQRTCWNKSNSWKVLRRQVLDRRLSSASKAQPKSSGQKDSWGVAEDDWGVEQDDWGDVDEGIAMVTSQNPPELEDVGYESNDDTMPGEGAAGPVDNLVNSCDPPSPDRKLTTDADLAADQMQQLLIDDEDDGEMQQCVPEDIQPPTNPAALQELLQPNDLPRQSSGAVVFEPYFVSVLDEPSRSHRDFRHEERLLAKYRRKEGFDEEDVPDIKGSGGGDEKYEKTAAKHGDVTFYKFMKKVELQPDQILRYEWNGKPLHISVKHQVAVPPCENCGKPRTFELQLMPALIPQLKSATAEGASVEFGTVLIYVCPDSCWTDDKTYLQESIFVEPDPDLDFFKC